MKHPQRTFEVKLLMVARHIKYKGAIFLIEKWPLQQISSCQKWSLIEY